MKKFFIAIGTGAMLLATTACGKSGAAATGEDRAVNDSISNLYGVVIGSQLAEGLAQSPEINKDDFLRGVATAVMAEGSDQSYQQGLSYGARIAQQLQYFTDEYGVNVDRGVFMKHLKAMAMADTVRQSMMEQQLLNQVMDRVQQRAQERKEAEKNAAPEAVANREAGKAFIDSLKKADPSIITTESGLSYKVIKEGEGDKVGADQMAGVIYKGSLIDGTVFDDSKGEARTFSPNRVVPGFGEGMQLMNKGAKYILYIPGDLAYGVNGQPQAGIGPNATLVFEVEIADIN